MIISRIPNYVEYSFEGMSLWFSEMCNRAFLFHPDDTPEDIVSILSGEQLFSVDECSIIKDIFESMFGKFGDEVYEAAYPVFMKSMKIS